MRAVPSLSIDWSAGTLRYRLDLPDRDLGEPLQEEFRQAVDETTLRTLQASAEALLRSPEHAGFPAEAAARGAVLYRTLVPARLRVPLAAVRGPLLVSTGLTGLPWELLHDDAEFWGLRYALGKRLVLERPLAPGAVTRIGPRPRALVIGSDPRGDLPFVGAEVDAVCEALEPHADLTCVVGPLASFEAVSAYLAEGFDLIHYCGHVVTGAATGPALLLADERPLGAAVIETNLRGRPLVFLNGCASARGGGGDTSVPWEATASSVAYAFLFGGAVAAVGTLTEVSDRHAATLADAFYRRVLEPAPIGEALRAAREHCRAQTSSAGSPTWLSFVLYGNPAQVLLRGPATTTSIPTTSLPTPIPAVVPEIASASPDTPRTAVAPAVAPRPRRLAWVVAAVLIALGIAGVLVWRTPLTTGPVVVGVMEVRAHGQPVPSWMRELTRDGLNTILGKFAPIRVYSRQKIDFLREKRNLSELEAAETLGMTKMLSASIAADASQVTLDLEVVDIATGLLEATERVQGSPERLMELQTELAMKALRVLGVEPSPEQVAAIVASRGNETLDAYRLLSETLGAPAPPTPPTPPAGSGEPPVPPAGPTPGTSWLRWQPLAFAQEPERDEADIHALLARYRGALEAKSIEQLGTLQLAMTDAQRASLQRYFDNAGELRVTITGIDVLVEGDEALATFTREDAFTDGGTGRTMRLEVRITGTLKKTPDGWKIVGLRNPT